MQMIRKATIEDTEQILNVVKNVKNKLMENGIDQWDSQYPTKDDITPDILSGLQFVLIDNDIVIGAISIDPKQPPEYQSVSWTTPEPVMVIHRLAVDPSFQGCGFAKKLVRFAEQVALDRQAKSIRLDAFVKNPIACGLYKKLGYQQLSTIFLGKREFNTFEKGIEEIAD